MTATQNPEHASDTSALEAARAQRANLHNVLVELEKAIAGPVPGRSREWTDTVHDALVDVGATFERHIAVTECSDGLFDEIVRSAPRLANAVESLRTEHNDIRQAISHMLVALRRGERDGADTADIREATLSLLARLGRHRQHGADLVYEAYTVDIGGSD